MKTTSRNKLLHCFRPMDTAIEPTSNLGFNYLILEKNDNQKLVSEKKRTLSRLLKAVFFETILAKRVSDKTKSCTFSKSTKELISLDIITPSSSCSSSESEKGRECETTNSIEDRRGYIAEKVKEKTNGHHNVGLYLLITISLAIVVLFGKLLAILFTSGWLFVVFAIRSRDKRRPMNNIRTKHEFH